MQRNDAGFSRCLLWLGKEVIPRTMPHVSVVMFEVLEITTTFEQNLTSFETMLQYRLVLETKTVWEEGTNSFVLRTIHVFFFPSHLESCTHVYREC